MVYTAPSASDGRRPRSTSAAARRRYDVVATANCRAPRGVVWGLLADVNTWTTWAGFDVATYEVHGMPSPHGVGAVRRFRSGPLASREKVIEFHPHQRFAYEYTGSLPVRAYHAVVTLHRFGGGTRIEWRSSFEPARPYTGALCKLVIGKILRTLVVRLARAAEAEMARSIRSVAR